MALSQPRDMAKRTPPLGAPTTYMLQGGLSALISAFTFIFLKWTSLYHTEQRRWCLSSKQDNLVLLDCWG